MSGPYGETRYGNSNSGAAGGTPDPFDSWASVADFRAGTADDLALTPLSLASNIKMDGDSAGLFFTNATSGAQFNVDGPGFGFNGPILAPLFTSSSDGKEARLSFAGLYLQSDDALMEGAPVISAYNIATDTTALLQFHGGANLTVHSDGLPFIFDDLGGNGFKFNQDVEFGGYNAGYGALVGYVSTGAYGFEVVSDVGTPVSTRVTEYGFEHGEQGSYRYCSLSYNGITQGWDEFNYGSLRLVGDGEATFAGMRFYNGGYDVAINTDGGALSTGALNAGDFTAVGSIFSATDAGGISFFGAGGSYQAAAIANATNATDVILRLNDLLGVVRNYGLIATA